MSCNSIKPNKSRVCVADLKNKIKIQFSYSSGSNAPDTNASTSFVKVLEVWAMIKTKPLNEFINGVNVEVGSSTDFYIRYTSDIDLSKELWIEFNGSRFRISNIENIDFEDRFILLRSVNRGKKELGAAQR